MKTKFLWAALLVLPSSFPAFAELAGSEATPSSARLEQLVEANIVAVHAYQMLLARKQPTMDLSCWPANTPKDAELEGLVAHQTSLLSAAAAAKAWAA